MLIYRFANPRLQKKLSLSQPMAISLTLKFIGAEIYYS